MASLPAHDRPVDQPRESELVMNDFGEKGYRWIITDTERSHIAEMLNVEPSELLIRGNTMDKERLVCERCGKHSGLDDLVHNALYGGIHSSAFMLSVLANGPHGESPEHELVCSRCTTKHKNTVRWPPRFLWKSMT